MKSCQWVRDSDTLRQCLICTRFWALSETTLETHRANQCKAGAVVLVPPDESTRGGKRSRLTRTPPDAPVQQASRPSIGAFLLPSGNTNTTRQHMHEELDGEADGTEDSFMDESPPRPVPPSVFRAPQPAPTAAVPTTVTTRKELLVEACREWARRRVVGKVGPRAFNNTAYNMREHHVVRLLAWAIDCNVPDSKLEELLRMLKDMGTECGADTAWLPATSAEVLQKPYMEDAQKHVLVGELPIPKEIRTDRTSVMFPYVPIEHVIMDLMSDPSIMQVENLHLEHEPGPSKTRPTIGCLPQVTNGPALPDFQATMT